jgi:hypothetical protein
MKMNIAIFGAGSALKDFLSILPSGHTVLAIADNKASNHGSTIEGLPVVSPQDMLAMNPELIIIASRAVDEIRAQLQGAGVPAEKIVAYYPSYSKTLGQMVNDDTIRLNSALGTGIPLAGVATMYLWPETESTSPSGVGEDFVRRHAMRLAAEWVSQRGVAGSIAELGVYQGEQAALLNQLFPIRTIHLFDTFQGFSEADITTEAQSGFSAAALGDFQDTSVDRVLARLAHPDRAIVHAGMFPDTAEGVEDQFAFVSLDVDLYEPTLAGLEYFYPRLSQGGFIFIHDYNNRRYSGVRHAVDAFLERNAVPALPLPDFAGTLVVLK